MKRLYIFPVIDWRDARHVLVSFVLLVTFLAILTYTSVVITKASVILGVDGIVANLHCVSYAQPSSNNND